MKTKTNGTTSGGATSSAIDTDPMTTKAAHATAAALAGTDPGANGAALPTRLEPADLMALQLLHARQDAAVARAGEASARLGEARAQVVAKYSIASADTFNVQTGAIERAPRAVAAAAAAATSAPAVSS